MLLPLWPIRMALNKRPYLTPSIHTPPHTLPAIAQYVTQKGQQSDTQPCIAGRHQIPLPSPHLLTSIPPAHACLRFGISTIAP